MKKIESTIVKLSSAYEITFLEIPVNVIIKIIRVNRLNDIKYEYSQSHFIMTPIQSSVYHPTSSESTEEKALEMALENITSWIDSAKKQGHHPKPSWFIKNDHFLG